MPVSDNLHRVQERIARAAESAGRDPDTIHLVGVTKYVGTKEAFELALAGCHDLGESRPQELWKKFEALRNGPWPSYGAARRWIGADLIRRAAVRWHLIGHLQRNKVARTIPITAIIHSVDSERLLSAINEAHAAAGDNRLPIDVLLEVNTSGESAKTGLAPSEVEPLLAAAPNYPHVAIRGLMTMAALEGGHEVAARNFATLRELRDRLKSNAPSCVELEELSMGMSDDFEVAIKEGATIVRVGSLLWE